MISVSIDRNHIFEKLTKKDEKNLPETKNRESVNFILIVDRTDIFGNEFIMEQGSFIEGNVTNYELLIYLKKIMDKLHKKTSVVYNTFTGMEKQQLSEIIYIKAEDKYTKLYSASGEVTTKRKIRDWEEILKEKSDSFLRIHRSYIVNMNHILKISDCVEMKNGVRINYCKKKKIQLKTALEKYIYS